MSEPQAFGKYKVLKRLAAGGMGEIYLAAQEGPVGFSRKVVVKSVLPQFADQAELVAMFLDEARISAMLTHPNIVHTYDFGQEGERFYMVLEFLKGQTLVDVIRAAISSGKLLSPTFVAAVGSQICAGLGYAHQACDAEGSPLQVVHRDISPQNILLTEDGTGKVLDFGIAKARSQLSSTQVGAVKGKPSYMSPEQISGRAIDGRTDLFALGVVLWESLASKRLFPGGSNPMDLARRICTDPLPSLAAEVPGVPDELVKVIEKALERDLSRRYQTAADFQRGLDSFLFHSGNPNAQAVIKAELAGAQAERFDQPGSPAPSSSSPRRILSAEMPAWLAAKVDPLAESEDPFGGALRPLPIPDWEAMSQTASPSRPGAPAELAPQPPRVDADSALDAVLTHLREPVNAAPLKAASVKAASVKAAPRISRPEVPVTRAPLPPVAAPGKQFVPLKSAAPRPNSRTVPLLVGGGVLVAGVGLMFAFGGDRKAGPVEAAAAPSLAEGLTSVIATIQSVPPGATIRVDGVDSGKVTPASVSLKTGKEHLILLDHPEFLRAQTKVFAAPRTPVTLTEKLLPGSRVTVKTTPPGAEISVDGEGGLRSPEASRALPLGNHLVVATLPGHVPVRREVELLVVAPRLVELTLVPSAEVEVTSTPEGAAILVDGVDTALVTPATVPVAAEKGHTVTLRKAKFGSASKRLGAIGKGKTSKLELTLELAQGKALTKKIHDMEAELAVWEARVARLRASDSGMIVDRSLKKELAHQDALDAAEKRVTDLEADLGTLREELEHVMGDGQ